MDDNMSKGRSGPSRLTFSLAFLLAGVTLVCVIVAILASFRGYTVTAYLQVRNIGSATARVSPQEIEQQAMNSLALATSRSTLEAALAKPGVGQLSNIQGRENTVNWLMDRLNVTFPGDGEIMEMRLEGRGRGAEDDRHLLQAVIDAYLDEIHNAAHAPKEVKVMQEPVVTQH